MNALATWILYVSCCGVNQSVIIAETDTLDDCKLLHYEWFRRTGNRANHVGCELESRASPYWPDIRHVGPPLMELYFGKPFRVTAVPGKIASNVPTISRRHSPRAVPSRR